ncbi:MAG TPA: UDP-glucose/GDP-mannose dehydrogenase family protein [Saprospiraceae bacterium]|nr:UDP-glucose/GDP-mannose dehydrogenase family protein [Saprospiraceae bacterium]
MHITVIGTGYVGLVTGTCFAETGNSVTCVDIDAQKVQSLRDKKVTIYEPGLELIFLRNIEEGRLKFTTDLAEGMREAQIVFLALPTPPGEDGSADLSYVLRAAEDLAQHIRAYVVIVDKSTVPVGTSEKVREVMHKHVSSELFDVVSNPEFLREGVAVEDFMKPDRVVVGTTSDRARKVMHKLYEPFVRQGNPIIYMDERSAEMTKYTANAYLATRISFMNEIANLCEKLGANVDAVRHGIGSDTRIGKRFLFPGIGYGGSCFPKDVSALEKMAVQSGYQFKILQAVMDVNTHQKSVLTTKLKNYFKGTLRGKCIALWGLAFKPNTDDVRDAPAIDIIHSLLAEGAEVVAFDPQGMENMRKIFPTQITYAHDMYEALTGADAFILATEWNVFRSPDFVQMRAVMRGHVIFDGRNVYSHEEMKEQGFYYESIGRP